MGRKRDKVAEDWFWRMLRAGLWGDGSQLSADTPLTEAQWAEVTRLGSASGTLGIMIDSVELLPERMRPSMRTVMRYVQAKGRIAQMHARHNSTIYQLLALFSEIGAHSMLMKGQEAARYYANPEARHCGDIDIYVGEEQIDGVLAELLKRGITYEEEIDDNEKHAVLFFNGLRIEIHRHSTFMYTPKADAIYQRWWAQGVADPDCMYFGADGTMSLEPKEGAMVAHVQKPELSLFFLFFHAFNHFTSSHIQFRQFCDIARCLYALRDRLDKEAFAQKLRELGLLKQFQAIGCYLHLYLGLDTRYIPAYDPALERKGHLIADRLRSEVLYHTAPLWKRPKGRIGGKAYSYVYYIIDAAKVSRIFPRDSIGHLVHNTYMGFKILFRKENRTGVADHYIQRVKGEG